MRRKIVINPLTRLEGHGKIDIRIDDKGQVEGAHFQVPDFKGFEKFCEGRALEEMPALTQKICGVCPTAHHIASSKTLDKLFGVSPPKPARIIRELMNTAFIFEDHLLHFFFLGGPDVIIGPGAAGPNRDIFGVIEKMGMEIAKKVIEIRKKVRDLNGLISGSPLYPVNGLPGGVSKPILEKDRKKIQKIAGDAVRFACLTLDLFDARVLKNEKFLELMRSDAFLLRTSYMGLVDAAGQVNFYDGQVRLSDPEGRTLETFDSQDYADYLVEKIDPWSYMKPMYLRQRDMPAAAAEEKIGLYRVGPLARLNVTDGLPTPRAHAACERYYAELGGKPVHNTLAFHWARLIEVLYAAERMDQLAGEQALTGPDIRTLPTEMPMKGLQAVGVCEAPRGTLLHHYEADTGALVRKLNLIVATQNNAAAISLSVEKAARAFIRDGKATDSILNLVEMAYRAYDPCLACATH
ncbi:MAG: Ni/Fe hydrogenase subunit alpha [Desulfobacterales bacterium]|nr:Ni/Fe hydrogenase subunit alpha [Desulfobacterales bacterium]